MEDDSVADLHGLPYELRIGITGHRNLKDPVAVRDVARSLLNHLVTIFGEASRDPRGPHGSPRSPMQILDDGWTHLLSLITRMLCPIINLFLQCLRLKPWPVVPISVRQPTDSQHTPLKLTAISSLAAGSDQIVADVLDELLQKPNDPCLVSAAKRNRYVEAVLPIPVEEYEQSFSSASELETFRKLLSLDRGQFTPRPEPTVVCPAVPDGQKRDQASRQAAFGAAGRYVVDASEIILAIWDPDHPEQSGGTAETARYALEQGKVVIWIHPHQPERGAQLLKRVVDVQPGTVHRAILPPDQGVLACELPQHAKELSPSFHRLAAFNRDNAVSASEIVTALAEESSRLRQQAKGKLPAEVTDAIASHILPIVVRADQLSLRYQALRGVALSLWPNLAACAVSLMGFQILFLPNQYWLAWVELGMLLMCAIAYRVSLHEAWHDKWRNDRRLAEGLRSALFSSLVVRGNAGLSDRSDNTVCGASRRRVENPLPFYSPSQSWFVATLKRLASKEQGRFAHAIDWPRDQQGIAAFLSDEWIERQAEYHARNAHRHEQLARRNAGCRLCMLVLIMLVAVLHALGVGHEHDHHAEHAALARVDLWIGWATLVLPAWAAALHALSSTQDHERLAERSQRMRPLLKSVAQRLRNAQSPGELAAAVHAAEELFDLENQEWSESLAERKPEFSG